MKDSKTKTQTECKTKIDRQNERSKTKKDTEREERNEIFSFVPASHFFATNGKFFC